MKPAGAACAIDVIPPPASLLDERGFARLGVFDAPLPAIDLDRAHIPLAGLRLPIPLSRLRLKEWQHFAVILPEVMISFAVVNAKYLGLSWCQFVDRVTGERFEHARRHLPGRARLSRALWNDRCAFRASGYALDVHNHLDAGQHVVDLDIAASSHGPAVSGRLICAHDLDAIEPCVVSLPVGERRTMYSHKVPLPVRGTLRVGDRTIDVRPEEAVALLDIHKAHYPRHTWWRWATCAGHDAAGRSVAVNLTRNVVLDEARWNENVVWVDGRVARFGEARFELDPAQPMRPWQVGTIDGAVELTFTPQGARHENTNLGLVVSRFHQLYGTFRGTARVAGGEVAVPDLFGVCEIHHATW